MDRAQRELGYRPVVDFATASRHAVSWLAFAGYPVESSAKADPIDRTSTHGAASKIAHGMTVTIVITAYNHARFLDQAIESVRAQTRPVDEVIVVDDGSDDDPAAVVERYPGVTLIRQPNQGLAAARNTGLHAATGTYIGFLDADDRLRPTMVEVNLRALEGDPDLAFVYGAYAFVDEAGRQLSEVPLRAPGADPYADFLSSNLVGMHGTVLYRREFVLDEGGFDASLPAVEDYDLYLRLARKHRVAAQDEVLADYRRHSSNMSNNLSFMLETVLAVHDRHRTAAASRRDWQDAFQRGRDEVAGVLCGQADRPTRASAHAIGRDEGDRPDPAGGAGGAHRRPVGRCSAA